MKTIEEDVERLRKLLEEENQEEKQEQEKEEKQEQDGDGSNDGSKQDDTDFILGTVAVSSSGSSNTNNNGSSEEKQGGSGKGEEGEGENDGGSNDYWGEQGAKIGKFIEHIPTPDERIRSIASKMSHSIERRLRLPQKRAGAYSTGYKEGELDEDELIEAALWNTDVFQKETRYNTRKTLVFFLVDASSSMGENLDIEKGMMLAFAQAGRRIKNFDVVYQFFPSRRRPPGINIPLKRLDAGDQASVNDMATEYVGSYTPLREYTEMCMSEIRRGEPNHEDYDVKLFVTLTDGAPDDTNEIGFAEQERETIRKYGFKTLQFLIRPYENGNDSDVGRINRIWNKLKFVRIKDPSESVDEIIDGINESISEL